MNNNEAMEDFRVELKTLVQNWQCSEKEWATSEQLWKEKERQWLERELEYFKNTENPAGDQEKKPWEEDEEEWEQKEASHKNQAEHWRSMEATLERPEPPVTGYLELMESHFRYVERQEHWARRKTQWLQKEAWFRGREQILKTRKPNSNAKSEELKLKLLQENDNLKASVAELHARVVASKKKELQFEREQDKWRDLERGLEKKITDMEYQVRVSGEELDKIKKDWLEREEALKEKVVIVEEMSEKEVKLRQFTQASYKKLELMCLKQKENWDEEKQQWTERERCLQQEKEDVNVKYLETERLLKQVQAEKNRQIEIMREEFEAERKLKSEEWAQYELHQLELVKRATNVSETQQGNEKDKILADLRKESEEREQEWKDKEARWIEENEKLKQQINAQNLSTRPETRNEVDFVEAQEDVQTPEAEKKEKKQRRSFFARIFRRFRKPNQE